MTVLDTHIWVWWTHGDARLTPDYASIIKAYEPTGLGIAAISCWEIAKLVEYGRLQLPCPTLEWLTKALAYPGVRLLNLTPEIAAESTQLPAGFHKDPADQMIVATARVYNCPLVTYDTKIRDYPHVKLLP